MFTSLRVGLACVKGLAIKDNIPIKGFSTLDALLFSLPEKLKQEKRPIVPVIDVRRQELYYRIYKDLTPISEPQVIKAENFVASIPNNAILIGSGINCLKLSTHNSQLLTYQLLYPLPSTVAFSARECILKQDVSNIETLVPFYVR